MPLFKFLSSGDMKIKIFVSTRLERLKYKIKSNFWPQDSTEGYDMHECIWGKLQNIIPQETSHRKMDKGNPQGETKRRSKLGEETTKEYPNPQRKIFNNKLPLWEQGLASFLIKPQNWKG